MSQIWGRKSQWQAGWGRTFPSHCSCNQHSEESCSPTYPSPSKGLGQEDSPACTEEPPMSQAFNPHPVMMGHPSLHLWGGIRRHPLESPEFQQHLVVSVVTLWADCSISICPQPRSSDFCPSVTTSTQRSTALDTPASPTPAMAEKEVGAEGLEGSSVLKCTSPNGQISTETQEPGRISSKMKRESIIAKVAMADGLNHVTPEW